MNFRRFLEMSDLAQASTSGINLKKFGDSYTYDFQHDGKNFHVNMTPQMEYLSDNVRLPTRVWGVAFQGNKGYSLTFQAGAAATKIYGQLILAIKKLMETEDVQALHFTAAEPTMKLMYERFYKQFLSQKFVKAKYGLYVDREYFRKFMGEQQPQDKQYIYQRMLSNNRSQIDTLKSIRDNKVYERRIRLMLPKLPNTIVRIKNYDGGGIGPPKIAYVISVEQGYELITICKEWGAPSRRFQDARGVMLDQPPRDFEIKDFLQECADSQFVNEKDINMMADLYKKYGVPIPDKTSRDTYSTSDAPIAGEYIDPPDY